MEFQEIPVPIPAPAPDTSGSFRVVSQDTRELAIRHVRPHANGWAVVRDGAARPHGVYAHKHEAIDTALEQAKREGGVVMVHNQDELVGA